MFTWKYNETVDIHASADKVWAIWSDPTAWPVWDAELTWVTLDGAFVKGTKGKMKPASGPEVKFELINVEPNKMFTDRAGLPLTTLDFTHFYTPADNNGTPAQITHGVEFRGMLAPLFGVLIGRNIKKHLRAAMLELANQAQNIDKIKKKPTKKY